MGAHTPITFYSGIVYSQALRLRRIINDQERLKNQLEDLKCCFIGCNYPRKMVNNICQKVLNRERVIPLPHSAKDDVKNRDIRVNYYTIRYEDGYQRVMNINYYTIRYEDGYQRVMLNI